MTRALIDLLEKEITRQNRLLLGICGAPGAGKSTISAWIVESWNLRHTGEAVLVPMDGYHFSNETLERKGLLPLKGIPDTFDAPAFIAKLKSIKQSPAIEHYCPRFDRSIEASIDDDIKVSPSHKLIVVEGNYLLLARPPWNELKSLLDQIWFIDADEELLLPRLLARHQEAGKSAQAAREKLNSTDLPNARLVAESKGRADKVLESRELIIY